MKKIIKNIILSYITISTLLVIIVFSVLGTTLGFTKDFEYKI